MGLPLGAYRQSRLLARSRWPDVIYMPFIAMREDEAVLRRIVEVL